jgi:hypothetical protein
MKILVDWLQVSCYGNLIKHDDYIYLDENKRTKQFLKLLELYRFGDHIATICLTPSSNSWRHDLILIKLQNKLLYSHNPFDLMNSILLDHNLKFCGISRLDLCTDFNYFYNTLNPKAFLIRLMKNKILGNNRASARFEGLQVKRWKMHYLRYGSHRSLCSVYLYNKTKEMNQKTFKPYIFENWQKSNLITDLDVWRLEFCIRPSRFTFYELDTKNNSFELYKAYLKECKLNFKQQPLTYDNFCLINKYKSVNRFNFTLDILNDPLNLNMIYQALIDHYFVFLYNDNKKNKSENRKLQLFTRYKQTGNFYVTNQEENSTKMDKFVIKKLDIVNNELNDNYEDISQAIKLVREYISDTRALSQKYSRYIEPE